MDDVKSGRTSDQLTGHFLLLPQKEMNEQKEMMNEQTNDALALHFSLSLDLPFFSLSSL